MKIGILSLYHENYNYGGLLQAFSLCLYLTSKCNAEQITYKYRRKKKSGIKKILIQVAKSILFAKENHNISIRERVFREFEQEIPHSREYIRQSISEVGKFYDAIIVGSDQVWNFNYSDTNYLLPFVEPEKRCSYAASFGTDDLVNTVSVGVIEELRKFHFLSVRERSTKAFLDEKCIKNCKYVCDPTLLISRDEWRNQINQKADMASGHREIYDNDYIVVYLLSFNKKVLDTCIELARTNHYKLLMFPHIRSSVRIGEIKACDYRVFDADPLEWVRIISEAKYIITDSFHCSVFSIIFNRNFWVIKRVITGVNDTKMNSRLESLLSEAGAISRLVDDPKGVNLLCDEDAYSYYENLTPLIDKSREYISELLDCYKSILNEQ